jgi:RND superfamily putative drug exporter
MRRPFLIGVPIVVVLLAAAAPLLHVRFGTPDQGVLPPDAPSRQVAAAVAVDFPVNPTVTEVVVPGAVAGDALAAYAGTLSAIPGVTGVRTSVGTFAGGARLTTGPDPSLARPDAQLVVLTTPLVPKTPAAQAQVARIRAVPGPDGRPAWVSSADARLLDTRHAIGVRLPLAAGLIALTTLVVLFLFTGSVAQPLRALALNIVSLSATLGILVWIFQYGHMAGLLGFTPRPLDTSMTVLLLCITFGLSMDYEVFVIGRITELHERGASTPYAVVVGLGRTGRIVSAAAALLAVSFFAFSTGSVSFLQMFGVGAGLAVLIDATLIRGVLLPAAMRLLGRAAWWAPRWLRRLYARIGLSD